MLMRVLVKTPYVSNQEVGRGKQPTFKLPEEGFSYGKEYVKDKEGAKEVISSWAFHEQSKISTSK